MEMKSLENLTIQCHLNNLPLPWNQFNGKIAIIKQMALAEEAVAEVDICKITEVVAEEWEVVMEEEWVEEWECEEEILTEEVVGTMVVEEVAMTTKVKTNTQDKTIKIPEAQVKISKL